MRLLSNVIRTGIISEVDEKSWCVRVRSGELETGWLRWNTTRAGAFNVWLPPSPGEQVVIACIGGNPEPSCGTLSYSWASFPTRINKN